MVNRKLKNNKTIHHSPFTIHFRQKLSGFTLIEVVLVMAIFAILISFSTINLIKPQTQSSLDSIVTVLVSDIKEQQIKSMGGDTEGQANPNSYGIRFETDKYILFHAPYNSQEASNFEVKLDPGYSFNTLPPTQEIIFAKRSGETPQTSFSINHAQTQGQKNISINTLGAVIIN